MMLSKYIHSLLFYITVSGRSRHVVIHSFSPTSSFHASRQRMGVTPFTQFTKSITSSKATSLSASIVDEVMDEMKKSMKAKDTITLNTIRLIRSSFANAAIDLKTEKLSDEDAQTVLKKLAKMRKESIDMFEKGGAMDRADAERNELKVIERWLPSYASDDTIRIWVQEAIAEVAESDRKNVGKIMGALMKKHKAEMDGTVAQTIAKEEIAKQ